MVKKKRLGEERGCLFFYFISRNSKTNWSLKDRISSHILLTVLKVVVSFYKIVQVCQAYGKASYMCILCLSILFSFWPFDLKIK